MYSFYDTIYLSPHLDDAALSCGGQIFAQTTRGKSALVVTIMAGDPPQATLTDFATSLHERWDMATNAVVTRRAEDVAACRILGADYDHWTIPDCIYRRHPKTNEPVYPDWNDVINGIHPAELSLVNQLAQQIANLPDCDRIIVPLTVGNHADHILVRLAAERSQKNAHLFYYEDYPYVQLAGMLDAVLQTENEALIDEVVSLRDADLAVKASAIAVFDSQLSTFFNGRSDLEKQITSYAKKVGGERIWHLGTDHKGFSHN